MLKTKKDIDRHVRNSLAKLSTENEKSFRGLTIAKLYFKINEYFDAQHYVSSFLSVKSDSAPGHRLLGQCYQKLNKLDKALESFQCSLQLDLKQPDLLIEICKILLNDNNINSNKAQYWCDLAESEKIEHETVFSLRLKLLGKDGNGSSTQMEERILKEISNRPTDPSLRVRFVCYLIEQNKILDAFKYAFTLEMKSHDMFSNSAEWYNVVWLAISKYKLSNLKKDWDFWLLTIICLEKQVNNSFNSHNNTPSAGITETANLLFLFDQHLHEATQVVTEICQDKELAKQFLVHFRGQLCLHAASLIFKKELLQNKNQWKETTKISLPLLILAYHCGVTDLKASWLIHCTEQNKQLIQLWNRQGCFRCVQAGRTLLSNVENSIDNTVSNKVNHILSDRSPWTNNEELLLEIRQYCSDTAWRNKIYRLLFSNSDQTIKIPSSHFVNSQELSEPVYELPSIYEIESYEELARYLKPQSLQHLTYLCLGNDNLSDVRCKYFNGLNFSTQNLSFCGVESLNQLDIETFLYATAIQAKRNLQVEKNCFENYQSKSCGRPAILPFVNLQMNLCTDEQINWWTAAYQVYKNLTGENLAEIRANLQYGIEAVRGINGPKIDLIIVLKLGNIFIQRSQDVLKPIEKNAIEARAQQLFKYGINMYKMQTKGVLEPFRRIFKYSNSSSSQVDREINSMTEEAVTHLAARYFKNSEYEECIEEFSGIQLPFATYFQSEAYKKLDESNKTPKKTKQLYIDKAKDCLNQTLNLLGQSNIETTHPLNSVIHSEIKNLYQKNQKYGSSDISFVNGSYFSEHGVGDYINDQSPVFVQLNRSRNNGTPQHINQQQSSLQKSSDIENIVKQNSTTLCFLKESFVDFLKPEISGLKKEIAGLKKEVQDLKENNEKLNKLVENNLKKRNEPPSRDGEDDAASNVLEDLYLIDDELQNQLYANQQQPQSNIYGNYQPQAQRMHTPNIQQQQQQMHQIPSHLQNPYNSPMYNLNYGHAALGYFPQYMMAPPGQQLNQLNQLNSAAAIATAAAAAAQRTPMGLGGQNLSYADPMNYNMAQPHQSQSNIPMTMDSRISQTNSLFGLLTQNNSNQQDRTGIQTLQQQIPSQLPHQATPFTNPVMPISNPQQQTQNVQPLNIWNKTFNNQPVEKGPPINVVITSSDPLPMTNSTALQTQPPLSVTIPPQHIKPSLVINEPSPFSNTKFSSIFSQQSFPTVASTTTTKTTPSSSINFTSNQQNFDFFKTNNGASNFNQSPASNPLNFSINKTTLSRTSESVDDNEVNKSGTEVDYDPRPDFKPIIPLPAEIEVKTGEENEEILFCYRAKLFRFADKEWKERGIGDIKILRSKEDSKIRILMRRDQTHKICANHKLIGEMTIQFGKNEEKSCVWAANDFADEELKLEKFCVRFKEVIKAQEFLTTFNMAKDEIKKMEMNEGKKKDETLNTTPFNGNIISNFVPKTLFPETVTSINETPVTKPTPFAGFSFDKNSTPQKDGLLTSKPFENIFSSFNKTPQNTLTAPVANVSIYSTPSAQSPLNKKDENVNRTHSDVEDDYIPTAQFKPVIPLPELVEVHTGEENEIILFEHRAQLLRFDKATGEWKERGLGTMKILQERNDINKVRLVMRREIIHKLCCNQRLLNNTKFTHPPKTECALSWAGQDFAENELATEMLTIRFKNAVICKQFHDAVIKAQTNMTDEKKNEEISSVQNENKTTEKGFGDKFKPKPGSWSCKDCYTTNPADNLNCVACEASKDQNAPEQIKKLFNEPISNFNSKPKFNFGFGSSASDVPKVENKVGFGDKFKPKPGDWSCKDCYTSNSSEVLYCIACEGPKDDNVPIKPPKNLFDTTTYTDSKPKFSFGFGSTSDAISTTNSILPPIKKDIDQNKEQNMFAPVADASKFSFGLFAPSTTKLTTEGTPNTAIDLSKSPEVIASTVNTFGFGKTPGSGFSFSNSLNTDETSTKQSGIDSLKYTAGSFAFSTPNFGQIIDNATSVANKAPFSFDMGNSVSTENKLSGSAKPAFSFDLGSNQLENAKGQDEYNLGKKDFNFVLKPKSPGKAKSPLKNNVSGVEDDSEDEPEEEENNTYFTPVIELPDKVDVKTGEENEEVLYCHRSKLFRYSDKEWKERGLGEVKILRHKETQKLRVVMRREQILKICLNHMLTEDIEYKRKDDKSWLFAANDYSEGEIETLQFCLRFKTKEIADGFIDAIKRSISGIANAITDTEKEIYSGNENISAENKKLADELKLPYNFFDNQNSSCAGCIGCDPDMFVFPEYKIETNTITIDENPLPLKMSNLNLNIKIPSVVTENTLASLIVSPPKLSLETNKSIFSGFGNITSANLFGGFAKEIDKKKSDIVASKFTFSLDNSEKQPDTKNTSIDDCIESVVNNEENNENKKSSGFLFGNSNGNTNLFASGEMKSMFSGNSIFGGTGIINTNIASSETNKAIFDKTNDNQNAFNQTPENTFTTSSSLFNRPLFGTNSASDDKTPSVNTNNSIKTPKSVEGENLFGQSATIGNIGFSSGGSIFGKSTFGNLSPNTATVNTIFGNTTTTNQVFGNIFSGAVSSASVPSTTPASNHSTTATAFVDQISAPTINNIFDSDNASFVSFASLAENANANKTQTTEKPGQGGFIGLTHQDAFSNFNKTGNNNTSNNSQGDEEENYDPQYEPIIELPKEIVVSTGEENEKKLYGERVTLFRYDSTNKEWKERGVGELKILQHLTQGTYRLLLRREQIHKLVLNHAINEEFSMNPMNNSQKAFCWATMNYAEENAQIENLAVRFKNADLAKKFEVHINNCLEQLKSRGDLLPEED